MRGDCTPFCLAQAVATATSNQQTGPKAKISEQQTKAVVDFMANNRKPEPTTCILNEYMGETYQPNMMMARSVANAVTFSGNQLTQTLANFKHQ